MTAALRLVVLAPLFLSACAVQPTPPTLETASAAPQPACVGSVELPPEWAAHLEAADAPALLARALGEPDKGLLCQGRVYRSKPGVPVTLYRAWNSTNPGSQFGNWWAWQQPQGRVADYRHDYEICYQWSPLDKLARCTLKPGVLLVVGTGQSAVCSPYLGYPVSGAQQIFLDNAASALTDCTLYDGHFDWK
jgi:hypothetical protein